MTIYARISSDKLSVLGLVDLTPADVAAFQVNGKIQFLRVYITVPAPVPGANQVVEPGLPAIDAVNCTQTWVVRDMTAAELEAAALSTEKDQIQGYIDTVNVQLNIDNATYNAMTNAQKLDTLRDDRRILLKAMKYLLRQAKRAA